MTPEEIEIVGKLADMCRSKGIRSIDVGGCKLDMGDVPAIATPKPTNDPDVCRCGHQEHQHMNGLCVYGCDAEKCADEVK